MATDVSREQTLRAELADEVTEARQHWVAENQYNLMLQEELERMQVGLWGQGRASAELWWPELVGVLGPT